MTPRNPSEVYQVEHRMLSDQCQNYEQAADEYLKAVEPHFFFDEAYGIYMPKTYNPKEKHKRLKKLWKNFRNHWATIIINLATVIGIWVYAHYARLQWIEMQRAANAATSAASAAQQSADTARDALVAVQRAFIFTSNNWVQEGNFMKVIVAWENSGTTPTKDMIMHVSWSGLRSAPPSQKLFVPRCVARRRSPHLHP